MEFEMTRNSLWLVVAPILLLFVACGVSTADETYVREMNVLMSRHLETYTNVADELDRLQSKLLDSPNLAGVTAAMAEYSKLTKETEKVFEEVLNQWAVLEPPDGARVFHAKAFEMMQLRLAGASHFRTAFDLFRATGQMDLDSAEQGAELWDESDRLYLDVQAEGRKADKALYK